MVAIIFVVCTLLFLLLVSLLIFKKNKNQKEIFAYIVLALIMLHQAIDSFGKMNQ